MHLARIRIVPTGALNDQRDSVSDRVVAYQLANPFISDLLAACQWTCPHDEGLVDVNSRQSIPNMEIEADDATIPPETFNALALWIKYSAWVTYLEQVEIWHRK